MAFTDYRQMSGIEKSALLLNVLGNNVTARIFEKMKDNDVKRLVNVMGQVEKVPIPVVRQVLEDFYSEIAEEENIIFGHASGRDFILQTLGEDRAKTVLGQLSLVEGSRTLEALEELRDDGLVWWAANAIPLAIFPGIVAYMALIVGASLYLVLTERGQRGKPRAG